MLSLRHARNVLPKRTFVASSFSQADLPKCDHKPPQYEGLGYDDAVKQRRQYVSPAKALYYQKPLVIHHGHMQYVYNEKNQRYVDLLGGICTISAGHCHPKVVKALKDQADKLWHTSNIYVHPPIVAFAKKLADKFPGNLKSVFLCNSGGEANDLALFMTRLHTGSTDIMSLRNAYHGMGPYHQALTAMSSWKHNINTSVGHHHSAAPDPYKGLWGGKNCRDSLVQADRECDCPPGHCHAGDMYAKDLEEVLNCCCTKTQMGGFFAEGIQGAGGVVQFPKNFIKKAYDLVKAKNGLFIADEVQTGFGRVGSHYWGFEMHGIMPDIVTMAKGIGNGMPLAAVVTTPEIAASLTKANHFNTFGGNPLSCAVGNAVIDAIDEDNLQENCAKMGAEFMKRLAPLREKYEHVGDVRGKGLMLGIELVKDRVTKEPLEPEKITHVMESLKDKFVLVGRGGRLAQVIRIKGPMCCNVEDVEYACAALDAAIGEVSI